MIQMFDSAEADLTVGQKDAIMLIISSVDEEVGDEIRQTPGVSQVVATTVGIVQLPEAPYFIVLGEDPRGFAIQHYRLIAGGPLAGRKQILLGKTAADNFKKGVGEVFRLNEVSYRVAGIYETGVSMEDGGAVMSLEDAQRAFQKRGQVSYFSIKLKDPRRTDEIKKQIESRWPDLAATRSGESTQQTEVFNLYRSFNVMLRRVLCAEASHWPGERPFAKNAPGDSQLLDLRNIVSASSPTGDVHAYPQADAGLVMSAR